MEATIVLVCVLTLVVGGMMLALVMGYRSIEESRAQAAERRPGVPRLADTVMAAGFFARGDERVAARPMSAFEEALLARLERHVEAEHAAASRFVHLPSVDSLYRHSGSSLHVH